MDILSKLPLLASSGAVASSIALPIVLSREDTQTVKQETVVVANPVSRKKDPGHTTKRWAEANEYLNCIEKAEKTREQCRSEHWFWDL